MGTGEQFVKWLRPVGCAVVLIFGIIFTVSLFTVRGLPVEGYSAPQDSRYYREHPEELCRELREGLLPLLDAPHADVRVEDGRVAVTAPAGELRTVRQAVIYYYDGKLFTFTELPGTGENG